MLCIARKKHFGNLHEIDVMKTGRKIAPTGQKIMLVLKHNIASGQMT